MLSLHRIAIAFEVLCQKHRAERLFHSHMCKNQRLDLDGLCLAIPDDLYNSPPVVGLLNFFSFFTITNENAMAICVQVFMYNTYVFISLEVNMLCLSVYLNSYNLQSW